MKFERTKTRRVSRVTANMDGGLARVVKHFVTIHVRGARRGNGSRVADKTLMENVDLVQVFQRVIILLAMEDSRKRIARLQNVIVVKMDSGESSVGTHRQADAKRCRAKWSRRSLVA